MRSDKALDYVSKVSTSLGCQYEFGARKKNLNTSEGKIEDNKKKYELVMNNEIEELNKEGLISINEAA